MSVCLSLLLAKEPSYHVSQQMKDCDGIHMPTRIKKKRVKINYKFEVNVLDEKSSSAICNDEKRRDTQTA